MYDVAVVAFDSEEKASKALADLRESSSGFGFTVIQAGLVKKAVDGLLLVDEFTGRGVDDQFMGVAAKVVAAAGVPGAEGSIVPTVAAVIEEAPAAVVVTVFDPDPEAFAASFDSYGATVHRWDLHEAEKEVHGARKAGEAVYREERREERHELHEEHKVARREACERFKEDVNL